MKKSRILALALALCMALCTVAGAASYTVQPGDMLWKIAKSFGTDYRTLAEYNGIQNPNLIFPGQVIRWNEAAKPETPTAAVKSFTGTATGFGGAVTVTLTYTNGVLTGCTAQGAAETAGIGSRAIDTLPAAILAAASADVDGVTGATISSNAVKKAAAQAMALAAGAAPEAPTDNKTVEADLLIIGAGGAGLTAANAALGKGVKKVVVLEKMAVASGASAVAGGLVGGGSKLQKELGLTGDSPDLIYKDLMTGGLNTNNPELLRLFADNQGATLDWLIDVIGAPIHKRYPTDFPEHTVQRFFVADGGSGSIIKSLADKFVAGGGTLLYETRATELTTADGAVTGCVATASDGSTVTVKAKKTVLATGGFGNNPEMLKGDTSKAVFYGVASSTGDGHKMAEAVGAKMVMMEYAKFYPQGISLPGTNTGKAMPLSAMPTTTGSGAIYVNLEGKRVCDENLDFVSIKNATKKQTDTIIFLVMDQKAYDIWSKAASSSASATGRITAEEQETYFTASKGSKPLFGRGTLVEAADKVGIDASQLAKTVDGWNEMVKAGKDADFGRDELFSLDTTSTYYIVEQRLRFATTLGGVDITANMEVKNTADAVIPNLYAAGEIVGGANGVEAMPGCMFGWAATSGRLVGEYLGDQLAK